MSFDLKLKNGDLVLGSDGSLQRVFDEEKLKQDILKIILTPTNTNSQYPWYGSPINTRVIGQALDPNILDAEVTSSLTFALNNLRLLQQEQERDGQFITPRETISRILEVSISQDRFDKRHFSVKVVVETRQASIVTETFAITA